MVYQQKIAACIKVDGKVLRETGDKVVLPFGSEYSVLIKNLNSVRVQVKVSVDGKDATEGTWLIVGPNSDLELERFISNGNLQTGNRFKFIERTGQIENHRGIKADDGLIRIEYKTERVQKFEDVTVRRIHYNDYYDWPWYRPYYRPWRYWNDITWNDNTVYGSTINSQHSQNVNCTNSLDSVQSHSPLRAMAMNVGPTGSAVPAPGITVPGSQSNQQFHSASGFDTHAQSEVIVLHLVGEVGGKKVKKAITTKTKLACLTCGTKSKSNIQFCGKCGTALTVF